MLVLGTFTGRMVHLRAEHPMKYLEIDYSEILDEIHQGCPYHILIPMIFYVSMGYFLASFLRSLMKSAFIAGVFPGARPPAS